MELILIIVVLLLLSADTLVAVEVIGDRRWSLRSSQNRNNGAR